MFVVKAIFRLARQMKQPDEEQRRKITKKKKVGKNVRKRQIGIFVVRRTKRVLCDSSNGPILGMDLSFVQPFLLLAFFFFVEVITTRRRWESSRQVNRDSDTQRYNTTQITFSSSFVKGFSSLARFE